jgi:hypothetical protein
MPAAATVADLFSSDASAVVVHKQRKAARDHVAGFKAWAKQHGLALTPADRLVMRRVRCEIVV